MKKIVYTFMKNRNPKLITPVINYGACLQGFMLLQQINKRERYAECDIIDYQSKQLIDINHPFLQSS